MSSSGVSGRSVMDGALRGSLPSCHEQRRFRRIPQQCSGTRARSRRRCRGPRSPGAARRSRRSWRPGGRRPTDCRRRYARSARNCRRSGKCSRAGSRDAGWRHKRSRSRRGARGWRRRTGRGFGRRCWRRLGGPGLGHRLGDVIGAGRLGEARQRRRTPPRACRSIARLRSSAVAGRAAQGLALMELVIVPCHLPGLSEISFGCRAGKRQKLCSVAITLSR